MISDDVSLFKDRWRVASDRARPTQQNRVEAYAAMSSSLKDLKRLSPDLLGYLCSEKEKITAQILTDVGNVLCRTEALHFFGCYVFHTEIARLYTEQDVSVIVKALCEVARDTSVGTDTCIRVLWCLSNQNFTSSHVQVSSLTILDTAGEVVCRYIHKASMVEMEALNLLYKLHTQCPCVVMKELQKWYKTVFLLLFSKVPMVQKKALSLATAVEKNSCTVLVNWVKEELKKTYLSLMLSRLDDKALEQSHVILMVWAHCIRLLGKAVRDTAPFLNQLLKVAEKGFKQKGSLIQSTVYTSWQAIITNFAQEHDVLVNHKRLHLILLPLISPAVKECVEQVDVARLNTWWYLIGQLGPSKQQLFVQTCVPFLFFCFGLDPKYDITSLWLLIQTQYRSGDSGTTEGRPSHYSVGTLSQTLLSKRQQLCANQGCRPFLLPLPLFLSGCHAILQFTGCAGSVPGSLLSTDLAHYGVYCTCVVPGEVVGVLLVLLDAILKQYADYKPSLDNQLMCSVIQHIVKVVMTTVGEIAEINVDRKLALSCLMDMFGSNEFEQIATLAMKVNICLQTPRLPFHIFGTIHANGAPFWKALQSETNCSNWSMNILLVFWQEVLTGAFGDMATLDCQRVYKEMAMQDQRLQDGSCLETMWEVVVRSLSETICLGNFTVGSMERELVAIRHVLLFPFVCMQHLQKPFTRTLPLWSGLYHSVNRNITGVHKGTNWFAGVVCEDILATVTCKVMKQSADHLDVFGSVLQSILTGFNWTSVKTEELTLWKELEAIVHLLVYLLDGLSVSTPSCANPYCTLMDVVKEIFLRVTNSDDLLMISEALAQPLANIWSSILKNPAVPTQETLPNVIASWSIVSNALKRIICANHTGSIRVLSPLLLVTLRSCVPELTTVASAFCTNVFDSHPYMREALLEYSKATKSPLSLAHLPKEVTIVEDSIMATADTTDVLNRQGTYVGVASLPSNKQGITVGQAVAVATNHANHAVGTSCLMMSSAPGTPGHSPLPCMSATTSCPNEARISSIGSGLNASPSDKAIGSGLNASPSGKAIGSGLNASPSDKAIGASLNASPSDKAIGSSLNTSPTNETIGSGSNASPTEEAMVQPAPPIPIDGHSLSTMRVASISTCLPAFGTASGPSTTLPECSDEHTGSGHGVVAKRHSESTQRALIGIKRPLECLRSISNDDVTILDIDPDVIILASPAKRRRITKSGSMPNIKMSPPEQAVVCSNGPPRHDKEGNNGSTESMDVCTNNQRVDTSPPQDHDVIEDTPPPEVSSTVITDKGLPCAQTIVVQESGKTPVRGRKRGRSHRTGRSAFSKQIVIDEGGIGEGGIGEGGIGEGGIGEGGIGGDGIGGDGIGVTSTREVTLQSEHTAVRKSSRLRMKDVNHTEGSILTTPPCKKTRRNTRGQFVQSNEREGSVPLENTGVLQLPTAVGDVLSSHAVSAASPALTALTTPTTITSTPTTPVASSCAGGDGNTVPVKHIPPTSAINPVGILKNPRALSNINKERKVKFASGPKMVCFIEPSQDRSQLTTSDSSVPPPAPDSLSPASNTSTDLFYPSLSSCSTPIQQIAPAIAGDRSSHGLLQFLKAKNISTVGNIASLTEQQIITLPIKLPKVQTLRLALERYEKTWELRNKGQKETPMIIDTAEPPGHPPVKAPSHQSAPPVQAPSHQPPPLTQAPSHQPPPDQISTALPSPFGQIIHDGSGFTQSQDSDGFRADDVTFSTPDSQKEPAATSDKVIRNPSDDKKTIFPTSSAYVDYLKPSQDHSIRCAIIDLKPNLSPSCSESSEDSTYQDAYGESEASSQPNWSDKESESILNEELQESQNLDTLCNQDSSRPMVEDGASTDALDHTDLPESPLPSTVPTSTEDKGVGNNWNKDTSGSQELFSNCSTPGSEGHGGPTVPPPPPSVHSLHLTSPVLVSPTCFTDSSTQASITYVEGCTQTPPPPIRPLCCDGNTQTPPPPAPPPCTEAFAQTVATPTMDSYTQISRAELVDQSQQVCPPVATAACQTKGPDVDSKAVSTTLHCTDLWELNEQLLFEMANHFDRLDLSSQLSYFQQYVQCSSRFTTLLASKMKNPK